MARASDAGRGGPVERLARPPAPPASADGTGRELTARRVLAGVPQLVEEPLDVLPLELLELIEEAVDVFLVEPFDFLLEPVGELPVAPDELLLRVLRLLGCLDVGELVGPLADGVGRVGRPLLELGRRV